FGVSMTDGSAGRGAAAVPPWGRTLAPAGSMRDKQWPGVAPEMLSNPSHSNMGTSVRASTAGGLVPISSRGIIGLDRYRLLAQLGAGPDGVSYRAVAEDDTTVVEVRDLSRAREDAGRWERLAPRLRLAAELEHPAAIGVLELGAAHEPPYVALEWVGDRTLTETRAMSRDTAVELLRAPVEARAEAHGLGLAHGRLGPGQVFLVDTTRPKLDFTGVDAGFPAATASSQALDAACRDLRAGTGPAAERAADLYGL